MPDIVRPEFPGVIDSSMMGYWRACRRKFWWRHIRNLAPKGSNLHLHAGGAFAKGAEAVRKAFYERGCSVDRSIAFGLEALTKAWGTEDLYEDSNKSLGRMLGGLEYYFTEAFPLATDYMIPYELSPGNRAVECNFGLPIGVDHPVTGEPILYAGRFDFLGVHREQKVLFIEDDKTTSSLGMQWSARWTLRSQFTGYVWGAQQFGLPVAGAVVRGISFLKGGYDKAESIQMRPQWMVDRWLEGVQWDIREMIRAWENDEFPWNLDESCASYGGCPYMTLCTVPEPEPFVPVYYDHSVWNPLEVKE